MFDFIHGGNICLCLSVVGGNGVMAVSFDSGNKMAKNLQFKQIF
jgi:hypothetical protein